MSNIFYLGIPETENRTTGQQTFNWIPNAYKQLGIEVIQVKGNDIGSGVTGPIFDSIARGQYSLTQNSNLLKMIREGLVGNNDKVQYQDFWTPGIEAVLYSRHLEGLNFEIYSTVFAQSVDEYDFTYPMRFWMKHIELGYDKGMAGIFVASQGLKDLLVQAGFSTPIHIVGLPFNSKEVISRIDLKEQNSQNAVIYTSRLDWEKNPVQMIKTAKEFLKKFKSWEWWVCSGLSGIRSNDSLISSLLLSFAEEEPRFKIFTNLSKNEYYTALNKAKIIFNSALQDWVSWTVIEATSLGCDICYPNFRSFPEFLPVDRMYNGLEEALEILEGIVSSPRTHYYIPELADLSALLMAHIVKNGINREINIWLERYYIKELLND